jgi:hypothetical protein
VIVLSGVLTVVALVLLVVAAVREELWYVYLAIGAALAGAAMVAGWVYSHRGELTPAEEPEPRSEDEGVLVSVRPSPISSESGQSPAPSVPAGRSAAVPEPGWAPEPPADGSSAHGPVDGVGYEDDAHLQHAPATASAGQPSSRRRAAHDDLGQEGLPDAELHDEAAVGEELVDEGLVDEALYDEEPEDELADDDAEDDADDERVEVGELAGEELDGEPDDAQQDDAGQPASSRPDVDVQSSSEVRVVRGSRRYHAPSCRYLINKESEARTAERAVADGYAPCAACRPDAADQPEDEPQEPGAGSDAPEADGREAAASLLRTRPTTRPRRPRTTRHPRRRTTRQLRRRTTRQLRGRTTRQPRRRTTRRHRGRTTRRRTTRQPRRPTTRRPERPTTRPTTRPSTRPTTRHSRPPPTDHEPAPEAAFDPAPTYAPAAEPTPDPAPAPSYQPAFASTYDPAPEPSDDPDAPFGATAGAAAGAGAAPAGGTASAAVSQPWVGVADPAVDTAPEVASGPAGDAVGAPGGGTAGALAGHPAPHTQGDTVGDLAGGLAGGTTGEPPADTAGDLAGPAGSGAAFQAGVWAAPDWADVATAPAAAHDRRSQPQPEVEPLPFDQVEGHEAPGSLLDPEAGSESPPAQPTTPREALVEPLGLATAGFLPRPDVEAPAGAGQARRPAGSRSRKEAGAAQPPRKRAPRKPSAKPEPEPEPEVLLPTRSTVRRVTAANPPVPQGPAVPVVRRTAAVGKAPQRRPVQAPGAAAAAQAPAPPAEGAAVGGRGASTRKASPRTSGAQRGDHSADGRPVRHACRASFRAHSGSHPPRDREAGEGRVGQGTVDRGACPRPPARGCCGVRAASGADTRPGTASGDRRRGGKPAPAVDVGTGLRGRGAGPHEVPPRRLPVRPRRPGGAGADPQGGDGSRLRPLRGLQAVGQRRARPRPRPQAVPW